MQIFSSLVFLYLMIAQFNWLSNFKYKEPTLDSKIFTHLLLSGIY